MTIFADSTDKTSLLRKKQSQTHTLSLLPAIVSAYFLALPFHSRLFILPNIHRPIKSR